MTAFIKDKFKNLYVVAAPTCIGRKCLRLGSDNMQPHFLSFDEKTTKNFNCCVRMFREGCPPLDEYPFTKEERKANLDKGLSIEVI